MKRHKDDADHARAAVRLTDGVAADLFRRLAVPAPERGGALLAVGGLVHAFVEDTAGVYSAVSWTISTDLSDVVGELEDDGHGVLAGTVHSHPAGVPDPSAVDISTTRLALRQNPHLSSLLSASSPPVPHASTTSRSTHTTACPCTCSPNTAAGPAGSLNRPGFDAASFLAKDAPHAEEVPDGSAGPGLADGPGATA